MKGAGWGLPAVFSARQGNKSVAFCHSEHLFSAAADHFRPQGVLFTIIFSV
jgi:hypothetical protein